MATNKQGRRTEEFQTAQHALNILPDIVFVDGDLTEAGFLALLNQIPMAPTFNKKFNHFEDDYLPATDTTSAAVTAGATTIAVTTPLAYNVNHLWMNQRTGEVVLVDALDTNGSTITVTREIGRNATDSTGTAAAAMNSGDTLIRLGPALGEVSRRQVAQSTVPTEVFNYTQKLRWEIQMSDVQRKTKHETGADWAYQEDKAFKQARKDLNGWLYLGERNKKTIGGDQKWYSGGLDFFISTNIETVSGTLHEYTFDAWLTDEAMRFGPPEKTCLASMNFIRAINQIAKDRISIERVNLGTGDIQLGVRVLSYMSPSGRTLNIMEDRFLTTALNGHARVVDLEQVRLRHFSGDGLDGRLKLIPNTQDVDSDDFVSTISGDMGPEWGPEKHHGKISGVTAGAAGRSVS